MGCPFSVVGCIYLDLEVRGVDSNLVSRRIR
jgi:hypothetical protein